MGHRVFARGDIEYYTAEEGKDLKRGNSQTDVEYVVEGGVPAGRMAISMDLESSELIHTPLGINGTGSRGQILGIDVARGLEDWVRNKIGRPILMESPLSIAFEPELDYKTLIPSGLWVEFSAEHIFLNDSESL